jgi:hypothetical protein
MPRRLRSTCVLMLVLAVIAPAAAAVDATGTFALAGNPLEIEGVSFRQSGTNLHMCIQGFGQTVPAASGTIDPVTGAFTLEWTMLGPGGLGAYCSIVWTGTLAPDGASFSASVVERSTCFPPPFTCHPNCEVSATYTVSGTRLGTVPARCCGDGVVDLPETCDGGPCCQACAPRPAGYLCPTDGNACTREVCDGNGACVHGLESDGTACNDDLFCNGADTCVAGACTHAGDPCAGGAECADTCNGSSRRCEGPEASLCTDDGTPTTADFCFFGHCIHPAISCGPCESLVDSRCVPAPAPSASCRHAVQARRGKLRVRNASTGVPSSTSSLVWQWRAGQATSSADFGAPTTSDAYALCVYGGAGAEPTLILQSRVPAGGLCGTKPCWQALGTPPGAKGVRYRDPRFATAGIGTVLLRPGAAGRSSVLVKGKGIALPLPLDPTAVPLPIRVQLRAENGACWENVFTSPTVNDGARLHATGD